MNARFLLALVFTCVSSVISAQDAEAPAPVSVPVGSPSDKIAATPSEESKAPLPKKQEIGTIAATDAELSSDKATDPDENVDPTSGPPRGEATPGKEIDFLQRSNLVLAKLLENERAVDPFGMVMDPANAKSTPLLADQYADVEEAAPALNNTSLKSAISSLAITGVYPQREMIVIGARSFSVGGQFGMKVQDLTIRLRFEGIRDGEIYFKDMETREVTSIPFNPRPAEFEPLTKNSGKELGSGISPMTDLFIVN